jgi:hypothetical protein
MNVKKTTSAETITASFQLILSNIIEVETIKISEIINPNILIIAKFINVIAIKSTGIFIVENLKSISFFSIFKFCINKMQANITRIIDISLGKNAAPYP